MQSVHLYATRCNFDYLSILLSTGNWNLSPLAFLAYLEGNLALFLHLFEPFQLFQQSCMFVFSRYDA